MITVITLLLLADIPAAIVMNTWEVDPDGAGMPVYSVIRPCGSGYQRIHSVPQWLVLSTVFASIVLPATWLVHRAREGIATARRARTPPRGFEVVLRAPHERR